MKFDIHQPVPRGPEETKEAFKWRFLLSLPESFKDAANQSKISAAVLHVRSGLSRSLFERLTFWQAPRLHNLPLQARWAAEALTEQGYSWKVDWYQYYDTGARHPALWVEFPWGSYNADQMAVFMDPARTGRSQAPRTEIAQKTTQIHRGAHLRLIWDRDTKA